MLHGHAPGDAVQVRQEARGGHVGQREEVGGAQRLHGCAARVGGGDIHAQLRVLGQVRNLQQ